MFLLTVPRQCFFCGAHLLFMFRVCHAFLSVLCSLVVTCWESACLLSLLCVMFSCVFITFPCRVLGQVWYLIVSISDLCLLSYFVLNLSKVCQESSTFIFLKAAEYYMGQCTRFQYLLHQ